jgi:hypothetical protein
MEHPFPEFQGGRIADARFFPSRQSASGRKNTIKCNGDISEEPERGGRYPGQDREAEWVCDPLNELLSERLSHVVVSTICAARGRLGIATMLFVRWCFIYPTLRRNDVKERHVRLWRGLRVIIGTAVKCDASCRTCPPRVAGEFSPVCPSIVVHACIAFYMPADA